MTTLGGALGMVGDAIGLAGLFADFVFPQKSAVDFNMFRVHVGLLSDSTSADPNNLAGNAPALAAWDSEGNFMSQITPDGVSAQKIAAGGFRDYALEGRAPIDYLSVVENGNDGICIHLITGQSTNNGRKFAWNGDLGKICGAPWYYQQASVTNIGASGTEFVPACIWIDGNGDNGHKFKGFNMHLGSFGGDQDPESNKLTAEAWNKNRDLLCKSRPRFSLYEDIKIGMQTSIFLESPTSEVPGTAGYEALVLDGHNWDFSRPPKPGQVPQRPSGRGAMVPTFICFDGNCPPKGGSFEMDLEIQQPTRRSVRRQVNKHDRRHDLVTSLKKRQIQHADRLVISNMTQHSAIELCNSISSLGPDLVSVPEGMFCDMSEKRLWPVCADSSSQYCFDMANETIRGLGEAVEVPDNAMLKREISATTDQVGGGEDTLVIPVKSYSDVLTWP